MVNDFKCLDCKFVDKCVAYNKLKAFTEDARVDLGVELTFVSCVDYSEEDEAADEDEQ